MQLFFKIRITHLYQVIQHLEWNIKEITLEEFVAAPVSQGQRLGELTVKSGEQILAQVPLVAKASVSRLTLGQLLWNVLRRLAMVKA